MAAPVRHLESRRERRKRQTRAAIVQAARELFVEKGFDETTLSEIAERADVGSSTLFTHFSTKAEIFFADYELFVQDHIRVLETRDREHESALDATIRWHREVSVDECLRAAAEAIESLPVPDSVRSRERRLPAMSTSVRDSRGA